MPRAGHMASLLTLDSEDEDDTPFPPPLMTSRQAVDSAQALLDFALST